MQKRLLSTRLFAVEQRVYRRDGGAPVTRDVIVHPGAVVILPVLDDGRIVMIRNFRYAVESELWELPAGTREPSESPVETARRELEEETGYRADAITPLMDFFTSPGVMTERMYAFRATKLTHVGQRLEAGERIETELLDVDEVRRRLIDGAFKDGKTIAVLATYMMQVSRS